MAVAVSEVYSCSQELYDIGNEFELDIHATAECLRASKFLTFEAHNSLERKESPQKEKQISVDPISLKESSMGEVSFNLMLPPINTPRNIDRPHPPPLPPAKLKFLSSSLPNSATSSPRLSSYLSKKWKKESQVSPQSLARTRVTLLQENLLRRSKSCGEGRVFAPSDELDLLMNKRNAVENENKQYSNLAEAFEAEKESHKTVNDIDYDDDGFKCGALCLFLPGFGKGKPVRPRKEEEAVADQNVISRTVSLEKFECGSWASSAIVHDHEDGESMNHLYFDLPLELIRNNVNDAHLPVNSVFVFDKDRKGVLKNGSTRTTDRKSHESTRHVRFSVSSPTSYPASPASCITPRLRKAREDFNAFLEAQSA